ncbi:MAG: carbonic anhydrase [Selenomonas sp.]|uniref:beta-class carbonic anhydrase n=1 Tax=Selenomonas sp. TaxID=2053611 RepID=UPI0025F92C8F|nr:carbonic anhydrase [Selenomonas sp.]MCR5438832.1 carbonic anhydrase [Selenomonas sp.]
MSILQDILAVNESFCQTPPMDYTQEDHQQSKLPQKQVAIITCMDTRLVNFLEPALGLARGDAKVIKTAGNSITGVFDGTIRSLMVCIYELGVKEILVIGHHECGMSKTTSQSLTKAMLSRGVQPEAIHMIAKELKEWADEFQHPKQNVIDTVEAIRVNPLIPSDVPVHGLIFHPRTGKLDVVIEGYDYAK